VEIDVKSLMLLQVILEACLVLLLATWLWRSWKKGEGNPASIPDSLKESIERFLVESEKIAETFQANLKDKKDLTSDLILKLDRRLADYRELLVATNESILEAEKRLLKLGGEIGEKVWVQQTVDQAKANPAAPEVRAMVLQLAKKGLSVEDIAVKAKLHRGEVELIIDLEHQFSL
jgi:hypothetical protein